MIKVFIVAWRDFASTVMTRSFLLSMVLPPLIMVGALALIPLLMNKAGPRVEGHIAVIDGTGAVAARIKDAFSPESIARRRSEALNKGMQQAHLPGPMAAEAKKSANMAGAMLGETNLTVRLLEPSADPDKAKNEIRAAAGKEKDAQGSDPRLALIVVPKEAVSPPTDGEYAGFDLFVAPKLDIEVQKDIERQVGRAIVDARIEAGGMQVDRIRAMTRMPDVEAKAVTRDGDKASNEVAKFLVPGAFMFLLWISVFTAGQYLLTSTIEEKSSRVMEVLLSAVSPMQLMAGKILAQMCVGLVILLVYAGAGMVGLVVASLVDIIDMMNLVYLMVYFFIAFALIASLMAAVGSAVSDIREAQTLMGPIMILLIIPMILWMPILRNPNSAFAQVCSFVPPLSPFVMVLRLAGSEKVPTWQIPATIALGLASVFIAVWAAAKIFRIGVLMYGKPPNFRTLLHWIRMA